MLAATAWPMPSSDMALISVLWIFFHLTVCRISRYEKKEGKIQHQNKLNSEFIVALERCRVRRGDVAFDRAVELE